VCPGGGSDALQWPPPSRPDAAPVTEPTRPFEPPPESPELVEPELEESELFESELVESEESELFESEPEESELFESEESEVFEPELEESELVESEDPESFPSEDDESCESEELEECVDPLSEDPDDVVAEEPELDEPVRPPTSPVTALVVFSTGESLVGVGADEEVVVGVDVVAGAVGAGGVTVRSTSLLTVPVAACEVFAT
jgi:hypothetical protein